VPTLCYRQQIFKVLASPAMQVISNGKPGIVYVNKLIGRAAIASEKQQICIVQASGRTRVVRAAP